MARYDTAELLGMVRSRAMVPPDSPMHPDARLLAMADDAVSLYLVPLLLRAREEHLNARADVPMVAGTSAHRVPTLAAGGALRLVSLVDAQGVASPPLTRLEPEQVHGLSTTTSGTPGAFYMDGNRLVLLPTPDASAAALYRLRLVYHRQPNRLCLPDGAMPTVDVAEPLDGMTTLPVTQGASLFAPGDYVDVVQGVPPFDTLAEGALVIAVDTVAGTVTVDTTINDAQPGDYVCPSGLAPVLQLPAALHALVALKVAEGVARTGGDAQLANGLAQERKEAEAGAVTVVTPRTPGHARHIRNGMAKWRGTGY